MTKYLRFYYIDTAIIVLFVIFNYLFDLDQISFYGMFGSGSFFIVPAIFLIISGISFIFNIVCQISKKFNFDETNLLFPKYYLLFAILLIILGVIYNQLTFLPGLHIMYYFTFAIIGYAMLSIYTSLSYKKVEKKAKNVRKKNK